MGHWECLSKELVWAWDLLHTLTALEGWLEHLYRAPAYVIKGEGHKWLSPVPPTLERVPTVPSRLLDALGLVNGFPSHIV